MKHQLLALLALFVLLPPPLAAAPKAKGIEECQFFWDVALVARSLAIEKLDADRSLKIMFHIYGPLRAPRGEDDERAGQIILSIVAAAQNADTKTAGEFAGRVGNTCMRKSGDMDSVLGVRL